MTITEIERIQRRNKAYWNRREMRRRAELYDKTVKQMDNELGRQYRRAGRAIQKEIVNALSELISREGAIQPQDLYKGGRYYKMMNEINRELDSLGMKQIDTIEHALLDIYEKQSALIGSQFGLYTSIDANTARLVIAELWCSDGRGFSDRIWRNKQVLVSRLEQSLFDFVTRGETTSKLTTELISDQLNLPISELTNTLNNDFREAYNNARRLVRTETARVQNRATQDRYREVGFTKYQIIAEPDCCEVCADLSEQVFDIDNLVIPAHPNCRCAMAAITESIR